VQQKIYYPDEHRFPVDLVDRDALYIMEKLHNAGFIAYLVGGGVRDLLLGQPPKDFDISTSAQPEEVKKLFRNCILIGRRFRLAHIRFGKKIIEVSTFRSGDIASDSLIIRDNEWGTPEEDALRRDFTINGLFFDPFNNTIIDYVGGFKDLNNRFIRSIGQPYLRFRQDPVRMIRLLKFQARFGFEIDEEAKIALAECRGEIVKSSSARVLEELLRMLESGSSKSFFELITHHGLLQLIFPALGEFLETTEGEEIYNYLEEVDTTFHQPGMRPLDRTVLLACLTFCPFEKHIKTHFLDRDKIPHLGEIQQEAFALLDEIFPSFCRLPRRMKYGLASILISQYRLTPLEKKKSHRLRVSRNPDFYLAIQFLEIRAALEPGLQKTWEEWQEVVQNPEKAIAPRKRRRRKQTSRKKEES
jgi:poly(A) polymerase